MYLECRHILPSGLKCKSPALSNRSFCYFHSGLRHFSQDGTSVHKEPLILPSLEELPGIQIALMQVLNAFGHGRIDRRQASLYLSGLQIATRLAVKKSNTESLSSIRAITCDDCGGDLAFETKVCEPPHDCLQCPTRDSCEKFEDYEYEVAEIEEQLAEQEEEEEAPDQQDEQDDDEHEQDDEDDQDGEDHQEDEDLGIKSEPAPPKREEIPHPDPAGLHPWNEEPASTSRKQQTILRTLEARAAEHEASDYKLRTANCELRTAKPELRSLSAHGHPIPRAHTPHQPITTKLLKIQPLRSPENGLPLASYPRSREAPPCLNSLRILNSRSGTC